MEGPDRANDSKYSPQSSSIRKLKPLSLKLFMTVNGQILSHMADISSLFQPTMGCYEFYHCALLY